jgi:protein-S-isoprenylcysteine O-methyltransferase Ste14
MKELIIGATLLLIFLLFVGHFSVSVKPFSISLPYWHRSLGLFLVIAAFYVYNIGEQLTGYRDGLKDGREAVWNLILEKIEEKASKI